MARENDMEHQQNGSWRPKPGRITLYPLLLPIIYPLLLLVLLIQCDMWPTTANRQPRIIIRGVEGRLNRTEEQVEDNTGQQEEEDIMDTNNKDTMEERTIIQR